MKTVYHKDSVLKLTQYLPRLYPWWRVYMLFYHFD